MKELHNAKYTMDLGYNLDVWRIHGQVDGEPIFISTPVKFERGVITTKSGSEYKVMSFDMNPDEFSKQVQKDIKRGGFCTK